MYLDNRGLIVQRDGDGGDTLMRMGFWYEVQRSYGNPIGLASYGLSLCFLSDRIGYLRRYPDAPYNDPKDVSRDQMVSNIRCMGYLNMPCTLRFILKDIIKNFSRYPNGDIAFLQDYGRFIRALNKKFLRPILWVTDLQLLGSSLVRTILSYYDKTDKYVGDDLHQIGDLYQAQQRMPTLWSYLARKIFKLRRNGPMYGMEVYFRPETGANVEFVDLWRPVVEKF